MFQKCGLTILTLSGILGLCACQEPGSIIASHFEDMALIAEQNTSSCNDAAQKLSAYYENHKADIEKQARKTGKTSEVEARRINTAAVRLETALEKCSNDPTIIQFKTDFSALILNSTGFNK